MRTLKDGTSVEELPQPITITINTKCPAKWILVDQETGEIYTPYLSPGTQQWKKIAKGNIEMIWK